ncbi:hypothetical protein D3C77_415660 [compost metagenome]
MNGKALPSSAQRCSRTWTTPAAVSNRVIITIDKVISQKPQTSRFCERSSAASPSPRRRGMA